MLKHLLNFFFPFLMLSFAAANTALGGGDGGAGDAGASDAGAGDGGDDGGADYGLDDAGAADDGAAHDDDAAHNDDAAHVDEHAHEDDATKDVDKETTDFKGLVSKRLVALKKEAPELTAVFQKYPKVQEQVEAAFRRDMA